MALNPAESPLVDFHQHAMPMEVLTWLSQRGLADLTGVPEGYITIAAEVSGLPEGARIPLPLSQMDPSMRLAELKGMGLNHACISPPPFLMGTLSNDEKLVRELGAVVNSAMTDWCSFDRDALIPLPYVPLGLDGYETWLADFPADTRGLSIGSFGLGHELDSPRHEELWAHCVENKRFIFVHPSRSSSPERYADYWLTQLLGFPSETALAAARVAMSGVLERHLVPLVLAHGGGCLSAVVGRLDMGWERKPQAHETALPPSAAFGQMYFDSATHSDVGLELLIQSFGRERIVIGSDLPFDLADFDPRESLLRVGGPELLDIVGQTGRQLLFRATAD